MSSSFEIITEVEMILSSVLTAKSITNVGRPGKPNDPRNGKWSCHNGLLVMITETDHDHVTVFLKESQKWSGIGNELRNENVIGLLSGI